MEPLRIGIVGAGAIAQRNAREAAGSGVARVVGVYDVNPKVARDMGKDLATRAHESYESLLDDRELDAVLISTPHHLHRAQCVAAAERGKHVMVEKPLANNLEEAEAIIGACRANAVGLAVNYSFRYLPRILKAKALVDAGAIGTITGVQLLQHQYKDRGYWSGARSNSPDDWRASRQKAGGGLLIMTSCHAVDYLYFITGLKATRVYSEYGTFASPAEVEDLLGLTCRFDNGAVGTVSVSSIMRGSEQAEERIWGTHGTMILDPKGISLWSTRPLDGLRPGKLHRFEKFPEVSWTAEWVRSFVASVREGKTPEVSAREGWENLAFITGAYRSLDEKRPVDLRSYNDVFGAS